MNDNFIECGNDKTTLAASNIHKYLGEDALFVLVALFPSPDEKIFYPSIARNITKADLQYALAYLNDYIESLPE